MAPTITLHALPPSHPYMTVATALELKGLECNATVPGALIDGEPIHGSRAILARLEHFRPEAMGTFAGDGALPLDGAGTDFAIKFVRATWRYHEITPAAA